MPETAAVRDALARIVASPGFSHSPRMSRFLRFVVDETQAGHAADLKEYVVGLRVFDKPESYDPTIDPTVRVEASKLRAKLAHYYETDGRQDPLRVEIPKGGYGARFSERAPVHGPGSTEVRPAPSPAPPGSRVPGRERLAWGLAALLAVSWLVAAVATRRHASAPSSDDVVRFELRAPDHVRVGDLRTHGPAVISPDGRRLAFVGSEVGGPAQIWVRALNALSTTKLPGTEGASYPFWSPDSARLGFFANGALKSVGLSGSAPDILSDAPIGRGGTWSARGPILFVPTNRTVFAWPGDRPAKARAVAVGPDLPEGEVRLHPSFLPDGRRFLFLAVARRTGPAVPFIGALDAETTAKPHPTIPESHSNVIYAAAGTGDPSLGYLLYVRAGSLMAQPVDATTAASLGEARVIASGVRSSFERWFGDFSASLTGVLVYRSTRPGERRLAWYDRQGRVLAEVSGAGSHRDVSLSPDRARLATVRFESSPVVSEIWIRDLSREVEFRLTSGGGTHYTPVWTRDGQGVYFVQSNSDGLVIYSHRPAEGPPRALFPARQRFLAVTDVSLDEHTLLFQVRAAEGHFDLWKAELAATPRATPILETPSDEALGQLSPDGRWLAYVSNESGRTEVRVCPVENPTAHLQVSANGGVQPRWRRDGRELFYIAMDGRLMSVSIGRGSPLPLGTPVALFQTYVDTATRDALEHFDYDVSLDGQRILTLLSPEPEAVTPWTVVTNWTAALDGR